MVEVWFFRAVKHSRPRKRVVIIRVIASRMLEYATRGRRSIYSAPGMLPEYFVPFGIIRSAPCVSAARLKVIPNFLRPRAQPPCNPVAGACNPCAYVQIQIKMEQVCNYLMPFAHGFYNADATGCCLEWIRGSFVSSRQAPPRCFILSFL